MDRRIVPGFHYRVQVEGSGRKLFGGRAQRLDSIGRGYAKRITFEPTRLNSPDNHFWSDSYPEGFGFEISAVRAGMEFYVTTRDCLSIVGHAVVFRDDCAPQVELHHTTVSTDTRDTKSMSFKFRSEQFHFCSYLGITRYYTHRYILGLLKILFVVYPSPFQNK